MDFFIGDLHIGHENLINFLQEDGITPERPFSSIDEMHEIFIERWNSKVTPSDKVYVIGDVLFRRKNFPILSRFNGKKSLVRGNHDIYAISDYEKYFKNIHTYVYKPGMIFSHIPLHPDCIGRWGVNVHAHLHRHSLNDPKYFCVSADRLNFTPISMEELKEEIKKQFPFWDPEARWESY